MLMSRVGWTEVSSTVLREKAFVGSLSYRKCVLGGTLFPDIQVNFRRRLHLMQFSNQEFGSYKPSVSLLELDQDIVVRYGLKRCRIFWWFRESKSFSCDYSAACAPNCLKKRCSVSFFISSSACPESFTISPHRVHASIAMANHSATSQSSLSIKLLSGFLRPHGSSCLHCCVVWL